MYSIDEYLHQQTDGLVEYVRHKLFSFGMDQTEYKWHFVYKQVNITISIKN